jgi:regulatory protein
MPTARPIITRIEPLRPRGLRVLVHLDDGEPFEVTLEALELSRLGVGDPLPPDARRHLLEADANVRVREAALSLLSHRARTRRELKTKLRQKGFGVERIDACLDRLEQRGLLDDEAVAAAFVRDRLRHRPRGKARLVSELRAKGVDAGTAHETIDQVFEDEGASDVELASESAEGWIRRQGVALVAALAGPGGPERDKARRRLHGYLSRRGFRGDALTAAMERATEIAKESGPDDALGAAPR